MIIVISPAKNLDYTTHAVQPLATPARMEKDTHALLKVTAKLSRAQIQKMMDLSENLAELNWQRFQALKQSVETETTLQAMFAFNGDVYQGLQARTMSTSDIDWAQDHLRILSGLYGVLRPLDAIAPYRLEMGTKIKTNRGNNLYDFWGARISKALSADLADDPERAVINLASTEYFSAIDRKALKAPIVTCHFKEIMDGKGRVLSFYAKRARGMMARFAIVNRIENPEDLQEFRDGDYQFDPSISTKNDWVFTRPQPDPVSA